MQNKNPEPQRGDVHAYTRGDASIDAQHACTNQCAARIRALTAGPSRKGCQTCSVTPPEVFAGDRLEIGRVDLLRKKIICGKTR